MSARALLEEIGARIESLEYAGDPSQIHASFVVGLKALPVRYKIRPQRDVQRGAVERRATR
jgi:hypothetical protein